MGQEKSLPVRCTPTSTILHNNNYRISQISSKTAHSAVSATSSNSSAISTSSQDSSNTTGATTTLNSKLTRPPSSTSRTSYKTPVDRQSKYLSEHLYIKSYLDIEEEDRNAKKNFHPAPQGGIRNYKPKIISEKQKKQNKEVDVWI
jgi:choline dehydrogenase